MPDPPFENFLTTRSLNGLRQKGCHILVKNWIFDDPFHKQLPLLVILLPMMISSGSVKTSGQTRSLLYLNS